MHSCPSLRPPHRASCPPPCGSSSPRDSSPAHTVRIGATGHSKSCLSHLKWRRHKPREKTHSTCWAFLFFFFFLLLLSLLLSLLLYCCFFPNSKLTRKGKKKLTIFTLTCLSKKEVPCIQLIRGWKKKNKLLFLFSINIVFHAEYWHLVNWDVLSCWHLERRKEKTHLVFSVFWKGICIYFSCVMVLSEATVPRPPQY